MSKKSESESKFSGKDIALVITAIGIVYILATNIIATLITIIMLGVVAIIGAYFILPRLGLAGLAALVGLSKR